MHLGHLLDLLTHQVPAEPTAHLADEELARRRASGGAG
jgi:hypothetical protein